MGKAYESWGIYTKRTGSGLIQKGDALTLARMHGELFEAIRDLPEVDAIPVEYIRKTSEEWESDGYEESAEALKILLSNWEKEK